MRFTTKIRLISLITALVPLIVATFIVTLLARAGIIQSGRGQIDSCT